MPSFAHNSYYDEYHRSMNGDYLGILLLTILLLVLLGVLGYFIFRIVSSSQSGKEANSALDEAKKRYAKGEITKKELDEIRKELKK